jgi:hypothetical protein
MSDKNKNTASEAVAVLKKDYDEKLELFNGLDESVSDDLKNEALSALNIAKEALDNGLKAVPKSDPKIKEKFVKGTFLLSPTGKYNLAYNAGESCSLPELQAIELEDAGYFKPAK